MIDNERTFRVDLGRLRSSDRPAALHHAFAAGRISPSTVGPLVHEVWARVEHPQATISNAAWRELFTAAGFRIDGVMHPRPTSAIQCYRGARWERRRGWSWTTEPYVAQWFAGLSGGGVYKLAVPPHALLAVITEYGYRREHEVVVDMAAVDAEIEMVESWREVVGLVR